MQVLFFSIVQAGVYFMPCDVSLNQPYKYQLFYTNMHNVQYFSTKASNTDFWLNYDIRILIVSIKKIIDHDWFSVYLFVT